MTGVGHWSIFFLSGRRTLEVTVTNITDFYSKIKKLSDLFKIKKTVINLIKYGLSNISSCNDLIHQ